MFSLQRATEPFRRAGRTLNRASEPERVLAQSTIFADLTPEERAALAKKLQRKLYEPGEVLLEPGVVLSSLFLIASGVLSVTHPEGTKWVEILRLGPGDHFGEIALLTGEGAWGRITALTPTVVYELPKKDLAPILEARPQVAHELSRALAQRQAAGRMVSSAERGTSEPTANASRWFTERLQKLFNLRNEWQRKGRPPGGGRPCLASRRLVQLGAEVRVAGAAGLAGGRELGREGGHVAALGGGGELARLGPEIGGVGLEFVHLLPDRRQGMGLVPGRSVVLVPAGNRVGILAASAWICRARFCISAISPDFAVTTA